MPGEQNAPAEKTPWEFRINKFKDVVIPQKTIHKKYNFWERLDTGAIQIGYHSAKETVAGETFGFLLPLAGEEQNFALQIDPRLPPEVKIKLLPLIREELARKGVKISQIIEGKKAARAVELD